MPLDRFLRGNFSRKFRGWRGIKCLGKKKRRGTGLPNPSQEIKFTGAKGDRELSVSPFQLTTRSTIGNLTLLILALAIR